MVHLFGFKHCAEMLKILLLGNLSVCYDAKIAALLLTVG